MVNYLSISVIIPTKNRAIVLERTLSSLSQQTFQPKEVIIIDASTNDETKYLCDNIIEKDKLPVVIYERALFNGAGIQRNQGFSLATEPYVLFMDDDIIMRDKCIQLMWEAISTDIKIGGVNAMIENQQYHAPSKITRLLFHYLNGKKLESYAGKCIGPAVNLLPEDKNYLPIFVETEWLNTTCTIYKKETLPVPPFLPFFEGYSLFEDLALSIMVGKSNKLINARTARIFHDSQPGDHKRNLYKLAKMEIINRHFVMVNLLERNKFSDYIKLLVFEFFSILAHFKNFKLKNTLLLIIGKCSGVWSITFKK